jgi:ABC-type lipoprotein release transport system permease subunit
MYKDLFTKLAITNIKKHKIESFFIFTALILSNLAILLTMALINGFNSTFVSNFIAFEPDIKLKKQKSFNISMVVQVKKLSQQLQKCKVHFSPVIETEGLLKGNGYIAGVKILGIPHQQNFYNFKHFLREGNVFTQENQLLCGKSLQKKMHLIPGFSKVKLVTSEQEKYFNVCGVFSTGLSDYDTYYIFVPKKTLSKMLDIPQDFASYINIKYTPYTFYKDLQKILQNFKFTTLKERNASLFLALKVEKYAAFIVLSLMFILCGLLIASLFIFQVISKKQFIALLKTFGFQNKNILKIFTYQIGIYYFFSIALTLLFYAGIVLYLNSVEIKLPENVYLIAKFPLKTQWKDVLTTSLFSFVIVSLSLLIPFRFIQKTDPSLVLSQRD